MRNCAQSRAATASTRRSDAARSCAFFQVSMPRRFTPIRGQCGLEPRSTGPDPVRCWREHRRCLPGRSPTRRPRACTLCYRMARIGDRRGGCRSTRSPTPCRSRGGTATSLWCYPNSPWHRRMAGPERMSVPRSCTRHFAPERCPRSQWGARWRPCRVCGPGQAWWRVWSTPPKAWRAFSRNEAFGRSSPGNRSSNSSDSIGWSLAGSAFE